MTAFISFLYQLIGEYGVTVVVCVLLFEVALIPFEVKVKKNASKKKDAQLEATRIKSKYGINPIGGPIPDFSTDNPEVAVLTPQDRSQRASEELAMAYRTIGYKPFTDWIPSLLRLIFAVWFYFGVVSACPEGLYMSRFSDGSITSVGRWISCTYLLVSVLTSAILPALPSFLQHKPKEAFAVMVAGLFAIIISLFIVFNSIIATQVAFLVAMVLGWLKSQVLFREGGINLDAGRNH